MKLYYSVQNCGDGSAYPMFLESEELATWDQAHMDEGWGESCTGSIEIQGEGVLFCKDVISLLGYYLEKKDDYGDWLDKDLFLAEFFPDGLPQFRVIIREDGKPGKYYDIYVGDIKHGDHFGWENGENIATEEGREKLENSLNAGTPVE